jgi:hypothetical protein
VVTDFEHAQINARIRAVDTGIGHVLEAVSNAYVLGKCIAQTDMRSKLNGTTQVFITNGILADYGGVESGP